MQIEEEGTIIVILLFLPKIKMMREVAPRHEAFETWLGLLAKKGLRASTCMIFMYVYRQSGSRIGLKDLKDHKILLFAI